MAKDTALIVLCVLLHLITHSLNATAEKELKNVDQSNYLGLNNIPVESRITASPNTTVNHHNVTSHQETTVSAQRSTENHKTTHELPHNHTVNQTYGTTQITNKPHTNSETPNNTSTHGLTTLSSHSSTFQTTANSSVTPPDDEYPQYVGFLAVAVAVLFYGSMFAPVKKFETGDGMFFQWVLCSGTLCVGIVVQMIRGTKNFYPIVMIGGISWETANITVVPIIKTIGMGLGMCIWGMTNLLSGWSSGRYGFFGLRKSVPSNTTLNLIGVILAVSSSLVFALVKNEVTPSREYSETTPLLNEDSIINKEGNKSSDEMFIDRLSPGKKRIFGVTLSLGAGLLYGQLFTPAIYMQQQGHSTNALDYVFACFCGLYLASTFYFIVYIIVMKNKPKIYSECILPGFISGLMWGIGTTCWFVANRVLSEPVAFPLVTSGPSIVASLWGVFAFREIRGKRNLGILLLGFVLVIVGSVLTGLSTA